MRQTLWLLARRHAFDVAVILAAAGSVVELVARRSEDEAPGGLLWLNSLAMAAMTLLLLGRRRFPFGAPAAVFLTGVVASFANGDLVPFTAGTFLTVLAGAVLFGMLRDRRQAVAGLAIAVAAAGVVVLNDPDQGVGDWVGIALTFGVAWLAGFALGYKLAQVEEAQQRATRLENEREERAQTAVADERARIARELHDVVGHSVSVMTVQASAVRRLLGPDQEREREALLVVEQTGREALAEMRRLVGVLRRPEEAPALAPQPSLEFLDKLVAHVREAGLRVELRVEGTPTQLSPGIDLTAYRLIQEGLTNALKHAEASQAEVVVRYRGDEVELVVSDDGRGAGGSDGGGHGLVGIRERVTVYGGELDAGPRAEGGYELRARLPAKGE